MQMAIMPGKENIMNERINDVIENMENYKVKEFKRAMQKYEGASFTLYVPKSEKGSGILKGFCDYYQVLGYALMYRIGDVPYSNAYLVEKEKIMQNYDEFEERMEKEDFTEFGICMHKKMTGICVENEETILSEGENGFFFCALTLIADLKSKRDDALKYALFAYDPTNIKDSKLNYYCIDKALFDFIFEFTKKVGDSFGR